MVANQFTALPHESCRPWPAHNTGYSGYKDRESIDVRLITDLV